MKQNEPIIQFNDVTFTYRTQSEPTLFNIDLTIHRGEKVVIVGPSGSGKSTLGHCINGLVPFSYEGTFTGSLTIKGEDAKQLSLFDRSKKVGTVLQDPDGQFISLTVGEDIAFSLENDQQPLHEMKKQVEKAAAMVGMESYLDQPLHALSGGQKQRVALAGVLVDEVDILLFDEPLANLDPASGEKSIELIDDLHRSTNATIVMIEHRLEEVLHRPVDRIIVVNHGRIQADGPPEELLKTAVLADHNVRPPLDREAIFRATGKRISSLNGEDKEQIRKWAGTVDETNSLHTDELLRLENVSFSYDKKKPLLENASFSIHRGEMISLVGRNGAGKSTLTKLISGFEKPTSGMLLFEQEPMNTLSIKVRAEKIGLVMQNPNHMISQHLIFDEVAFGLKLRGIKEEEIKKRVEDTLTICGLYPYRNWPIAALSFGQKKRVTIASILVLNPDLLILDEPTAGQDLYHYTELMTFLRELNARGITIMLITHDMHVLMEYTDRTIVLADGRIAADGHPVEILQNPLIREKANLRETSLLRLAQLVDVPPGQLVQRFISKEAGVL